MAGPVEIREIGADDLAALTRFLSREVPAAAPLAAGQRDLAHYRWFLIDNPHQPADVPCGWIARDASGEVVGSKFCVGERFRCAGQVYTLLMGGGFYVSSAHRGLGLRLMQRYLAEGTRHALYSPTMNETSGALYEHYGGYAIAHSDHEWLGVLHARPVAEEWLARRSGRPGLARLAAWPAALRPAAVRGPVRGRLEPVADAGALAHLAIDTPPEHAGDVTALRDEAFLRWRYFEGPDPTRALFVYHAPAGGAALVGVNLRRRGGRGQVRALMVLDYFGALPAAAIADAARALAARYRDRADMIVFRGQPAERQHELGRAGFLRRALPRAVGVCIDRHGLLPTRSWYLVPADGDMGH